MDSQRSADSLRRAPARAHEAKSAADALARALQSVSDDTARALLNALRARDPQTHEHSLRVGSSARQLAPVLGYKDSNLAGVEWAGRLHDLGKLRLPEAVLSKPALLTDEERVRTQTPAVAGHSLVAPIGRANTRQVIAAPSSASCLTQMRGCSPTRGVSGTM